MYEDTERPWQDQEIAGAGSDRGSLRRLPVLGEVLDADGSPWPEPPLLHEPDGTRPTARASTETSPPRRPAGTRGFARRVHSGKRGTSGPGNGPSPGPGLIPELERTAPARCLDQTLQKFVPGRALEAIAARGRWAGPGQLPWYRMGRCRWVCRVWGGLDRPICISILFPIGQGRKQTRPDPAVPPLWDRSTHQEDDRSAGRPGVTGP